ncbi:MAG: hypothetical protein HY539_03240 [Deltaproteobacteria bacterium]|nr:hypothetical protein [Deltaproteobacteria bacterium]
MSDDVYISKTVVPVVIGHVEAISLMPSPRELLTEGPYASSERLRRIYVRMASALRLLRDGVVPKDLFDVVKGEVEAVEAAREAVGRCALHVDDFVTPFSPAGRCGEGILIVSESSLFAAGNSVGDLLEQLDLRGQLARSNLLGAAKAGDVATVQRYFDPVCRRLLGIVPFAAGAASCLLLGVLICAGINQAPQI